MQFCPVAKFVAWREAEEEQELSMLFQCSEDHKLKVPVFHMFSRCGSVCHQEHFEVYHCPGVLHGQFTLLEEKWIANDQQQLLGTQYPECRVGKVVVPLGTCYDTEPMNRK